MCIDWEQHLTGLSDSRIYIYIKANIQLLILIVFDMSLRKFEIVCLMNQ